jgi:hypothetical protein
MALFVKEKLECGFVLQDHYSASKVSAESDATSSSEGGYVSAKLVAINSSDADSS